MKTLSKKLGAIAATSVLAIATGSIAAAQDVVIVSAGGGAQEAHRKATWEPAAAALGFDLATDSHQGTAEARAQVDSGAVTWDLVNFNMGQVQTMIDGGYLVKLPEDIVDRSRFAPGSVNDYCVGNTVFSQIIGYSTETFADNPPSGVVDLFDVENFPGIRGLYRGPLGLLEAAAINLGNSQEEVYAFLSTDEGLDAAFARIEELIEAADIIWWDSGAQLTQLHIDGEIDISYGWDGRIVAAREAGAPVDAQYQDGILAADCYGLLTGSPNPENAIVFLKEISKAEYAKDIPLYFPYGSPNLDAYADYDEATLAKLTSSPANVAGQFAQGVDFWGPRNADLSERFDEMLLILNQ